MPFLRLFIQHLKYVCLWPKNNTEKNIKVNEIPDLQQHPKQQQQQAHICCNINHSNEDEIMRDVEQHL